jgi:acyl dehydratase
LPTYKDATAVKPETTQFPIELGRVRDFATALLDSSPHYKSKEKAAAAGLPGIPTPITFPMCMGLYEDDVKGAMMKLFDAGIATRGYVVHGEQEFVYHRPVYVGETLAVTTRIVDAYQKEGGRGGLMTFFVAEAEAVGADGKPAFASRMLIIERTGAIKK